MKQLHSTHLPNRNHTNPCLHQPSLHAPEIKSSRRGLHPGFRWKQCKQVIFLFLLLTIGLTVQAQRVLIIYDDATGNTLVLRNALQSAGFTVTLSSVPEYQWNGTNPALTNFDCVVHLNGSTYGSPMPVAGQTALVNFVNAGKGYIGSEWLAYEASNHTTMQGLMLADRVSGREGSITYTQNGTPHPVLNGIPASFTFTGGQNIGPAHTFATNPVTVLMTDQNGSAAVMLRQVGAGKAAYFNHAANYIAGTYNTLGFANIQNLYINAIRWATAPTPVISALTPQNGSGAGTIITISGSGFTGATAVSFGGTAAASYTVVNASTITAVLGAGASGTVTVTTPGGIASFAGFSYCAAVTPAVSIVAGPAGPVCQQTPVTFTATPVNGGSSPVYQWLKNGNPVGTNSNVYTESTPANGDVIRCVLTSNAPCLTAPTATSGDYTLAVNAPSSSSVSAAVCTASLPYVWNGNPYNAGGTYTLHFTNAAGCDSTATLVLTVNNSPAAGITNNSGSTLLTCALTSVNVTATGGGSYAWNAVLGNSPGGNISVPGTYTVTVTAANGCTDTESITVTQNLNIPAQPSSLSGIINVCQYVGTGTPLTYSVPADPNATAGYQWVVPPTVTIVSGQGTNSIVITANNGFIALANKQLRVTALSSCGNSPQAVFFLHAQLPTTPSPIVASTANICPNIGTNLPVTYTIPRVTDASSYIWTAQSGTTTITSINGSGVNDTAVTVTFSSGFTTSAITVRAVNDCGTTNARSFTITRNNPGIPALISGPTNACPYMAPNGTPAAYSITSSMAPIGNVTGYNWTVPAGSTGLTGQGTNSISFIYPSGFTSGTVTVTASNGCGVSATRSLSVGTLNPATPGMIDVQNLAACPNRQYSYTIATMPANAQSVQWTAPAGATIVSGQGTTSIVVSYPGTAVNGNVTATAVNNCGSSVVRFTAVKLPACPPPPPFAGNNNPLFKGNVAAAAEVMNVNVYPNPTTTDFKLQVLTAGKEEISVRVLDMTGRFIKQVTVMPYQTINIGAELKAGSYMIEVRQGSSLKTTRVLKF